MYYFLLGAASDGPHPEASHQLPEYVFQSRVTVRPVNAQVRLHAATAKV